MGCHEFFAIVAAPTYNIWRHEDGCGRYFRASCILTSSARCGRLASFTLRPLHLRIYIPPVPNCIEDWVGPNAYLDIATDRQFSVPTRNYNPVDGPVRHSTEW